MVKRRNVIVAVISDQDVVIRVNKEMVGRTELPSTHDPNKIALEIKDLKPMAFVLTRHNISIRQKTNTNGTLHLTFSISIRPKLPDKLTLGVENLNTVVAFISHDIISLLINNNTLGVRELTITLTIDPNTRRKVPFSSKI